MKKLIFNHTFRWLIYTIFLFIFQMIYLSKSHGVYSLTMFLVWTPALAVLLLSLVKVKNNWISAGAFTAIIGLALHGVFQIAGTGSSYIVVYEIVSPALSGIGLLLAVFTWQQNHYTPRHLRK